MLCLPCALGCLEIVVDLVVAVFFWSFFACFSLFDGCFYLEYRVLRGFLAFSLMVNSIFNVSLTSLLLPSSSCVVFDAADEAWLMLPDSC
jgi:hypothetical protein